MPTAFSRCACVLGVAVAACAPAPDAHSGADLPPRPPSAATTAVADALPAASPPAAPAPAAAPPDSARRSLTLAEARRYMLQLVNRDRATMRLPPVELDEGAPTRAGQAHAEDMARNGYLGHWGSDGSVPEQRYTQAGGMDMVLENASCFTDERRRTLDPQARVDPRNVEQAEDMFFHEQPPNDGHRKNILKPWHKRVGIGVAQPVATATEIPVPCFSQEFVDPYGTYGGIPAHMHVGDTLVVTGTLAAPATFAGVGLARVPAAAPLGVAELNQRRSYPVPTPYQMYWPPGFQTPIPVQLSGNRFAVSVPLSDGGRPGMYELSVWATLPGTKDFAMVSLRTIDVR